MNDKPDTYHDILKYLRQLIESGELAEGALLPSENDLGRRFKVNRNWPRRALRTLEAEGLIQRAQGKRSAVAPASSRRQVFRIGKVPTLAIALPRYLNPFERAIADGFMNYAARQEVFGHIYTLRLDGEDEREFLERLPDTGVSGLAFWPQQDTPAMASILAALGRRHFPVVQVDRYVRDADTDFVVSDNESLMRDLTRKVLEHGHQRIAYASVVRETSSGRERFAGFQQALREAGLSLDNGLCRNMDPEDAGTVQGAVTGIMKRRNPPTACICANAPLAAAVLNELDRLNLPVTQPVELAAVDDVGLERKLRYPVLCVRQRGYEMGWLAAEQLLARLYDPGLPVLRMFLPPDTDTITTTGNSTAG